MFSRSFCVKVGLQILLREYDFDSKNKVIFNTSDIMNVFPVVKHINPRVSNALLFFLHCSFHNFLLKLKFYIDLGF